MKVALLVLLALIAVAIEAKHFKKPGLPPSMDQSKPPVCSARCERVIERHEKDNDRDDDRDDDDDDDDDNDSKHGRFRHGSKWFMKGREHGTGGMPKPEGERRPEYDRQRGRDNDRHSEGRGHDDDRDKKERDHDDDRDKKERDHDDDEKERDSDRHKKETEMRHFDKDSNKEYMKCRYGMLFNPSGCPMCICAREHLCHRVKCAKHHACHIFKDGDVEKPYCVAKDLIPEEQTDDDKDGCFGFFKHHKRGAIILSAIILVLVIVGVTGITCYCIKKKARARQVSGQQRVMNEKPIGDQKDCPPPYYIYPDGEEKKVEPTDFVSVPPTTPPPRYTSTTSLRTISEEDEKKKGLPELSC